MIIQAKTLVGVTPDSSVMNYQIVKKIFDFEESECIIVPYLNPDLTLLLSNIKVIITERGSALSHLAIVAREYRKAVFLAEGITQKIAIRGRLFIQHNKENKDVKIKIL